MKSANDDDKFISLLFHSCVHYKICTITIDNQLAANTKMDH